MPHYRVQGCKISSQEIERVIAPQDFERIIIYLKRRAATDFIDIEKIVAEYSQGTPSTNVNVHSYNQHPVPLNNDFIDNFGQFCVITKCMITAFGKPSLELTARKHHYRGTDHPTHTGKHFIGYKVKVKKH